MVFFIVQNEVLVVAVWGHFDNCDAFIVLVVNSTVCISQGTLTVGT